MEKTINFWLFGISIILLGASLFLNVSHTVVTNESIVLVFVGILATFIVVGNYAQVTEIKNNTNIQIKNLELKTQNKIDELNKLFGQITEASERIKLIEKNADLNAADARRLYGAFCLDRKLYRNSCKHLLDTVSLYTKYESYPKLCDTLLNAVVNNIGSEKWNSTSQKKIIFNYQEYLAKVKEFPDKYTQKQKIIDLLETYSKEEIENKEE